MYKPEINNRTNNSFSDLQGRSVSLILRSSFLQGVMSAIILGSLFAGIWTIIPSNILPWGSSKINILGYASHCPFAPFSSLILFGICVYGIKSVNKLGLNTSTGYMIFSFGIIGIFLGIMNSGIGFSMLIYGTIAITIGVVSTVVIGLLWRYSNESSTMEGTADV